MSIEDVKRFPLPPIADDALLFLWRVASMQQEALDVIRAWGFELKSEVVWVKTTAPFEEPVDPGVLPAARLKFGMGRYFRGSHETCLIARRGRAKVRVRDVRSVFFAPVGEHSAKPAVFFTMVERLATGPIVELFARGPRPGWVTLGDQVGGAG